MGNVDSSVGGHLPCLRVGSVGFWLRRTQGKPQAHLSNGLTMIGTAVAVIVVTALIVVAGA